MAGKEPRERKTTQPHETVVSSDFKVTPENLDEALKVLKQVLEEEK